MTATFAKVRGCGSGDTCEGAYASSRGTAVVVGREITDPAERAQLSIGSGEGAVEVTSGLLPEVALVMDEAALGTALRGARHDLFRLEVLDYYDPDRDDYQRYVSGEPGPDMARVGPWLDRLRAERARGLCRRRVHIVRSPIGDYLRYECEWAYAHNVQAGEEVRILDLAEREALASGLPDFWLVDGQTMLIMRYDPQGRFAGATEYRAGPLTAMAIAASSALWDASEPFQAWWGRHHEYRRSRQAA